MKVMWICVTVALSITFLYYFGKQSFVESTLRQLGLGGMANAFIAFITEGPNAQLNKLTYWVGILTVSYLVIPALVIRFRFKEKLRDYGISPKGSMSEYRIYLLMLCVMLPLVLYFSGTASFQERYPFYNLAPGEPLWPRFWLWQLLYLFQFFALEFFFRGFMVLGLRQRFGYYSVFVMTIPYCMIHFGKPMPETVAAIIAGIVLGTLSLQSRSVWMGILIHYTVAITMDLAALWRQGMLF